jgi:hypothetical protein
MAKSCAEECRPPPAFIQVWQMLNYARARCPRYFLVSIAVEWN